MFLMNKQNQAKSVEPFRAGMAVQHLEKALNELVSASAGYVPSERVNLMESITRLSLVATKNKSRKVRTELSRLLSKYEKEYGWIHETW